MELVCYIALNSFRLVPFSLTSSGWEVTLMSRSLAFHNWNHGAT